MYFSKEFKNPDLGKRAKQMQAAIMRFLKKAGMKVDDIDSIIHILTIWGVVTSGAKAREDIETSFGCIIIWCDHFAIEGIEF